MTSLNRIKKDEIEVKQWRSWAQLGALARIELLPHPASHLSSIVLSHPESALAVQTFA